MSNQGSKVIKLASGCTNPVTCPLNQVKAGTAVKIKQLDAPPEVAHRLREMGFCEEQKLRLLTQNTTIICQVCNARFGLSTDLARQILVEPLPVFRQAS